jgi:hypothetical protein
MKQVIFGPRSFRKNVAGQNHVCAFFNTMDEEHRVLGSFYKGGFDRGEKLPTS